MLGKCSGERKITGIDYDERKIASASEAVRAMQNVNFRVDDLTSCAIPPSEVYILNDVLHYLTEDLQISLLVQCMDALPAGGMLIVRDADAELKRRTLYTKFTEIQSTRVFRFNKTRYPLTYLPSSTIEKLAEEKGFKWRREDRARLTSNITYIISR